MVLVVVGSPGIEGLGGLRLLRLRILRILRMRLLVVIVLSPIVVPLPTELRLLSPGRPRQRLAEPALGRS